MNETRLPSIHSRVSRPGFNSNLRNVSANLPSHPLSSAKASPASSRSVGFGGTARCPQFEQNAPLIGASQFRHWTSQRVAAVGNPCTRSVDCSGACRSVISSLPLDGRRRLGAHVVHDAGDALQLVDDAAGYTAKYIVGEWVPIRGHAVHAGHRPQGKDILIGPEVTLV